MSTYAYPGFRPELSSPQGTFGLPSFGAFGQTGAPLEELRYWGTRATSAAAVVAQARQMGNLPSLGKLTDAGNYVSQAQQLIAQANATPGMGYSPNPQWTQAHEQNVAIALSNARTAYNAAAGIAATTLPRRTFPPFPTWVLAHAGVPEGGAVPTGVAVAGDVKAVLDAFIKGIEGINKDKSDTAADDAATDVAAAGGGPDQVKDAATVANRREQDSQRQEIAKTQQTWGLGTAGKVALIGGGVAVGYFLVWPLLKGLIGR